MNVKLVGLLLLLALCCCALYNVGHVSNAHSAPVPTPPLVSPGPTGTGELVGPPTITAEFIDHVLAVAHSPAVGIGQVMYTLGVQFHIDPVYALAFFHHESSYGKYGVAAVTHSIGNIRCSVGYACDAGYRAYPTWASSVQDWYRLMQTVYLSQGLDTVARIIPVYAPTADHNDEGAYIASVLTDVALYRRGEVQA